LRTLQEDFKDQPFTVLAFPCNQFGAQEPGSDAEILEFATSKYGANFPIFSKIDVNGSSACDLYQMLKAARADEEGNTDIPWNFAPANTARTSLFSAKLTSTAAAPVTYIRC